MMEKKRAVIRYKRRSTTNSRVPARRYRVHTGAGNNKDLKKELSNLNKLLKKYTEENENLYNVLRTKTRSHVGPPMPPVPPIIKTGCKSSCINAEIVKVKLAITDQVLYRDKWKDDDDKSGMVAGVMIH